MGDPPGFGAERSQRRAGFMVRPDLDIVGLLDRTSCSAQILKAHHNLLQVHPVFPLVRCYTLSARVLTSILAQDSVFPGSIPGRPSIANILSWPDVETAKSSPRS